jgi:GT2 family glycosyltransferase
MLKRLDPPPLEILITADGCTDDTVRMVNTEMENAKLIVNEVGLGSVASRDHMMHAARGDIVLSLDDDSYPEQLDCLAHIAPLFEQNSKLAVASFPQRSDEFPETLTQSDFGPARPTRSFPNSGAALRRSIYLQLPGFETKFFHAYEEPDYALQCVAAGYTVWFTPAVTIRHHYSGAVRNEMRTHHRHSRNECWSVLLRCPLPQCLGLAAYRILAQFLYACKRGPSWVVREPVWWAQAIAGLPYCWRKRNPVRWQRYKQWLEFP